MANIPQSFWRKVEEVRMEMEGAENHLMLDEDGDLHLLERWRTERALYRRANREWRAKPKDI